MEKKRYVRVDPFTGFPEKDVKEDAPTTSTAGVAATGDDPTVVVRKKKKLYDGRTRIAKKFVERILKQRESRRLNKEEVELDEVLKPKDKKVIDDFVQANKGTGVQNFTQRGNIVDYEGRSLEKSGMGAQQIASIESDPKDSHKIKVHAKMDSRSTQSIVNYLKKSAKKYNIKVEETVKEEIMTDEDFRGYGKHFALTLTPTLRKKVMKLLDKEKIEYDKFSRKFLFIGKDGGKAPISMKDQKSILSKIEKEIGKDNFNYTFQKEDVEFDNLEEEVMTLKTKDAVMGLKVYNGAKGLGLKAALLGKYVRVKGSKKQVNDFGRTVIGKSSMGSPTELKPLQIDNIPQEDRILNKRLKEELEIQTTFTASILEKVNDFGNEHELVETNLKVLQNIVKKKQNQKVKFKDKQATVDLFTASAIMKVYDAVKPDNKKKIEKLMNGTLVDFLKLQKFAMKQVKFA